MTVVYKEAFEKLKINDTYNAAQKFLEAELLFPQLIGHQNLQSWLLFLLSSKLLF